LASFFPLVVGVLMAVPSTLLAAPRVAVIETKNTAIVIGAKDAADRAHGRREIAEAVSTAVERAGGQIVAPPQAPEECASQECVKRVGSASGATYVLVIDAAFDQDSFKLHLDMWSASSGDHLDGEGQDCDGCTVNDLTKALRDRTTLLCDRVFRAEQSTPTPKLVAPPPVPSPTAAPALSVTTTVPPPVHQPALQSGKLILGGSLAALGIAGIVTGSVYLHEDGEQTNCESVCRSVYNTRTLGISVLAGGLVAGGIGGWLLWSALTAHDATVAVGPGSIAIAGRF
jgi:hypothetical protein